jgi:hypothetical protein
MPKETLYRYRIYCDTETEWVMGDYRPASEGPQTTCPHDTAHTINPVLTSIVEEVPPDGTYDSDGNLLTVPEPRSGAEKYFYVNNLCDPCSWWPESTRITDDPLGDSGDHQTYTSGKTNWIDLRHGRVFREDDIPNVSDYFVVVEVSTDGGTNWTPQTENPWGTTTGDYTVDYEAGTVTFNAALDPADLVRASFNQAGSSAFTIEPEPGKRLKVLYVEVQLTDDVVMTGDVIFDILAYNPADPSWDPAAVPPVLPRAVVKSERYKRIIDFFQESTGPYPVIPAFGGPVRGIQKPIVTLPFQYLAYRDLKSSQGVQLQVRIEGDTPMDGSFANATFYCLSELEPATP